MSSASNDPNVLSCFSSMWGRPGVREDAFAPNAEISLVASALTTQFNAFCGRALAQRSFTDGVSTLTFQFLPRREVNAYAFRRNENAYVAANLGVLTALLNTARNLVSHAELRAFVEESCGRVLDTDKLSALIMSVGVTFLFAHEVGHHYYAHLHYLQSRPRAMILDEAQDPSGKGAEELLDRQALELQADTFALSVSIANLNDEAWRMDAMDLLDIQCETNQSATLVSISMAVAFFIVFLTLRFSEESHFEVISMTDHPAPHHRLIHALSSLTQESRYDSLPIKSVARLLVALERAWPEPGLRERFYRSNDITSSGEARAYLTSLWNRADDIEKKLRAQRWKS